MRRRPRLQPGEQLQFAAGAPSLVHFRAGHPDRPLVLFVPGAGHLGRIAYGHPGCESRDFLAWWLQARGFPFAAVSYPLQHAVYGSKVYPSFSIRDWGRQAAAVAADIVRVHGLSKRVVAVGWSMAGHLPATLHEAAVELGIDLRLFVSVCGTPPLPGQLPGLEDELRPTPAGLASIEPFMDFFQRSMAEQNALNGHTILAADAYAQQYLGPFSVNLWGSSVRYRRGRFVRDESAAVDDMGSYRYHQYPLIATLVGDRPTDPIHVLTDRHRWALYQAHPLYARVFTGGPRSPASLSNAAWDELCSLFEQLPTRLSETVHGNHWCFVGERGARQTASAIEVLVERAEEVWKQLEVYLPRT